MMWQSRRGTLDGLFAGLEDVAEHPLDGGHGVRRGVDRDVGSLPEVERAHVVEAHDVIGVGVREEYGVEAVDARAQGLSAEVGRGIDRGRCGRRS